MVIDAGLCNRESAARQEGQARTRYPMCFGITLEGGWLAVRRRAVPVAVLGATPHPQSLCNPRRITVMKPFHHLATASLILPASLFIASCSAPGDSTATDPAAQDPGLAVASQEDDPTAGPHVNAVTEAPTGFDGLSNGNCTQAEFRAVGGTFSEVEAFEDGMGPTFNNTSCISCHESPRGTAENDTNLKLFGGTASQITE